MSSVPGVAVFAGDDLSDFRPPRIKLAPVVTEKAEKARLPEASTQDTF
jgi:hypothetical protein